MQNPARLVYDRFRESMLAKTSDWQNDLAEDVRLTGPLAQVAGKAAFIAVNEPFFAAILDSRQVEVCVAGDFIITQIITEVSGPDGNALAIEVSEWYEIKNDRIQSLRTYFDPRPLLG